MAINNDLKQLIRKYAVKNAVDFGKADVGSVIGKVVPYARGEPIDEIKSEVKAIVSEINKMKKVDVQEEYQKYSAEFERKAKQTAEKTAKPKMELEGAQEGQVVTRISPEPSGYMHIGHVKQALLSGVFAQMYKGKLYRYWDDTNPEKCKQEYVDSMKKDQEWLGLKFDGEYYASDNVEKIYDYAKQLIEKGRAYACTCSREAMQKNRFDGVECEHRKNSAKENLEMFKRMQTRLKAGDVVIRFMGDMKSQNTVLRDPVMLRIVEAPHYRQGTKYRVWPVYDFNTPILDSIHGITDVIRSKEYELRDELGKKILESLGLRVPRMHLEARLNIRGNTTHKREIRELIQQGKVGGWDDPRLMTIMALRRRGVQPEAIKDFVLRFGMSKTDSEVPLDMLMAENKKIIDGTAKHLFFTADPVKITIKDAKSQKVRLRLHPVQDYGEREYVVHDVFYISESDGKALKKNEVIRLKDLMDVKITTKGKEFSAEVAESMEKSKIIQWVSYGNCVKCTILVPGDILDKNDKFNPNGSQVLEGLVENYAERLNEHEIVQFERFGYCILDNKKKMQFIFISK